MLLKFLKKYFKLSLLKDELRKIGVNFITAGGVGVFINHFVGTKFSVMFWTSFCVTLTGVIILMLGMIKSRGEM